MRKKVYVIWTLVLVFTSQSVFAQIPGFGNIEGKGSEYFVGRIEGKPLIKVNLISGVRYPGVYHIPIQTNLAQLLSYAGGANDNADLGGVAVRTQRGDKIWAEEFDLKDILEDREPIPVLQDNDIIHLPAVPDKIYRASVWLGILSTLATTALTITLIEQNRKNQ